MQPVIHQRLRPVPPMLFHADNTVHFENNTYRVTNRAYGALKKKDVSVYVYEDGSISAPALNRRDVA